MLVVVILNHMRSSNDTDFENPTASALLRAQLSLELSCSPRSDSLLQFSSLLTARENPKCCSQGQTSRGSDWSSPRCQVSAQPGITLLLGAGGKGSIVSFSLAAGWKQGLAQHSLKNCAALVHSEKPLGLKKVKWVMGENYFWPMNI